LDVELVGEPTRTAKAETEAPAGRITIAQRHLYVRDAWTIVFEREAQPAPSSFFDALDR
jgi:hypothetical protein